MPFYQSVENQKSFSTIRWRLILLHYKKKDFETMDNKVVNGLPMCYTLLDDSANSVIPLFEIAEKNIFTKIDYSLLSSYCPLWMIKRRM